MQPFSKMDVKLMPYALELVTKIEGHFASDYVAYNIMRDISCKGAPYVACTKKIDDIYRLVRNCHVPELIVQLPFTRVKSTRS